MYSSVNVETKKSSAYSQKVWKLLQAQGRKTE